MYLDFFGHAHAQDFSLEMSQQQSVFEKQRLELEETLRATTRQQTDAMLMVSSAREQTVPALFSCTQSMCSYIFYNPYVYTPPQPIYL